MKTRRKAKRMFLSALLATAALAGVDSMSKDVDPAPGRATARKAAKVDVDLSRMNKTMRATYIYRLAASPKEFSGKTLRVSGTFLTRVDAGDGKRYFGCLLGDMAGCSCCAPAGVLEFVPKGPCAWPEDFPPVESRIVVEGRVEIFKVEFEGRSYSAPRLVDAEFVRAPK